MQVVELYRLFGSPKNVNAMVDSGESSSVGGVHMRKLAVLLGALGFVFSPFAGAQDTGRITGSVVDPSGAVVAKATINLLLHDGTKPIAATQSNAQGLFTLEALRPVYFDLTVDAKGFQQYKLSNVKVNPSRDTDLPLITVRLAATATTVTNEQISRLPVGDRNPLAFISTQAGVAPTQYETVINGQRSSFSNVTLD